ncbi:hypothetical protein HDU98_006984 [Podochytrium sp. JEL0797]|nr:hypothetical protein HDU98_006984 [Podochytrium sp. JEL0797]
MTKSVTNTNTCLGLASSLAICSSSSSSSPIDIPSAICCDTVFKFNEAGCFCNPITKVLLGTEQTSTLAKLVRPVCAFASWQPWKWIVPCRPFQVHTYNNGVCPSNDMQMDAARFVTAGSFQTVVATDVFAPRYGSGCFDLNSVINKISPLVDPAYTFSGGYGLGVYSTPKVVLEYFAILNAQMNKNYASSVPDAYARKVAGFLPDGAVAFGGFSSFSFFNEKVTTPKGYAEYVHKFDGCTTSNMFSTSLLSGSVLNPALGQAYSTIAYIAAVMTLGQDSTTWGAPNTCKFHTTYCTGANAQFTSEQECLDFFTSLPQYSPVCGYEHILSGNSRVCRAKHQFMTPSSPEIHCAHLSPTSVHCRDDDCGPGGDASQVEKIFNQYKKQVDDITAIQDAAGLGSNWTLPHVC